MILYKPEEIYYIFNQKTKKIYIEESYQNNIIQIYLSQHDLRKFSIDHNEYCTWKSYRNISKNSVDVYQIEFEKLLLEKFK